MPTLATAVRDGDGASGPDLRLLAPAMAAWGVCAATLELPPLVTLGAAMVTLVATVLVPLLLSRRSSLRHAHRDSVDRRSVRATVALAGVAIALVLSSTAAHRGARQAGPLPTLAAEKAVVTVVATVRSDPRLLPATDERPAASALVTVRVTEVRARARTTSVNTPVVVFGDPVLTQLRWSETVRLTGRLSAAEPGESVEAVMRLRGVPERIESAGPLFAAAEFARDRLRAAVGRLPADARGLVPALVIGDRSLTPDDLTEAMRATGLTHLSAVSGTNVSFVLMAVMLLVRVGGVPRRARPTVGLVAVLLFVVLARPDPSVLRAAVMGAVGLIGVTASRRAVGAPALGLAVIVLLVSDPWLARSHGFALSVLASAGLLLFARPWAEALARYLPARVRPLAFAVAVPMAAQATCGPVIVLLQGGLPAYGVLANVLAAPLVAPVTLAGLATAVVALVNVPFAGLVAWVAGVPALGIAAIARSLSTLPGGVVPWPDGALGAVLLVVLTCLVIVMWPAVMRILGRWSKRARLLTAVALLGVWISWMVPLPRPSVMSGPWAFAACDVGQGDALVLPTGEPGHAVLVDTGRDPRLVDRCLDALGVTVLDALVLTHYDGDHMQGLDGAVSDRVVSALVVSEAVDGAGRPRQIDDLAGRYGIPVTTARRGQVFEWSGVRAVVLNPQRGATDASMNDASLVLDLRTRSIRALLLADVEQNGSRAVLRALKAEADPTPIDVVKVSHHGSAHVADDLYQALRPRLAVISVGAENDYGHPAPSVLAQLSAAGTVVWRTDYAGTVVVGTTSEHTTPPVPLQHPGGGITPTELWVKGLRTAR